MKEVTLTIGLLHHEKDNRNNRNNPTDHNNSSDDTANDDANKVTAYRTKRSLLIASATALNAHMTLIILQ